MRKFFSDIKNDRITFGVFLLSFLILIITVVFILVNYKNIPAFIPIFNQLPWGNERLTPTFGIFIPIFLYIFIYVFNLGFSSLLYGKGNPLLARVVASVSLLLAVMNFVFIIKTLLLIL
ncbi:MAG: hypothetical protein HYT06_01025 [Candidatus Levybacteria bacterium]|nr:hypothetical protein [Candidatus Levybacteria bacterium]